MEVKDGRYYTFSTTVENQTFTFNMFSETRDKATEELIHRLNIVLAELKDSQNQMKAKSAN